MNLVDAPAAGLLGLAAAVQFGTLVQFGFDWGDLGSYAQIVYEQHLGGLPGEFVGYGPLWYFIGLAAFKLAGVNYSALLNLFAALLFAVTALLYLSTRAATGRVWPAAFVAAIFILVPPFTASTVRALCLAINALPLIALAKSGANWDRKPLLLAAFCVGLTFLLRPDFGYIFLVGLSALAFAYSWKGEGGFGSRAIRFARALLVSAALIALVLSPLILDAWLRGYLAPVAGDYLSYPRRFIYFLTNTTSIADAVGSSGRDSAFLRVPPVGAVFDADPGLRAFAFLIYSTIAVLIGFTLAVALRWFQWRDSGERTRLELAILIIVGSQWPIFFLFRPSWVHFATFMHAYILLAGYLAVRCVEVIRVASARSSAIRHFPPALLLALLACQAVVFVVHGLSVPGVGVLAQREGRTALFSAEPGIKLWVTPSEKQHYETLDRLIRGSSAPRERIVCVPYCPGFAFMTGRRLLFAEHYVDDSTPRIYPGWIDHAIARTRQAGTSVVIVQDWAPNGTASSRFTNWASRYMDFLHETYPRVVPVTGASVYLRNPRPNAGPPLAAVADYGPKGTSVATAFNIQPDGTSAVWLRVPDVTSSMIVELDGVPLRTVVAGDVVTALVPLHLLQEPGRRWLQVTDSATGRRTPPVPFDIPDSQRGG